MNFQLGFTFGGSFAFSRDIDLPPLWTWRELEETGAVECVRTGVDADSAWRGWMGLISVTAVTDVPVRSYGGPLQIESRGMTPFVLPGVVAWWQSDCGVAPPYREIAGGESWHSSIASGCELCDGSIMTGASAESVNGIRATSAFNATFGMVPAWEADHPGESVPQWLFDSWVDQAFVVMADRRGYFARYARRCWQSVLCMNRLWKDASGALHPGRSTFYADEWKRWQWHSIL